MRCSFFGFLLVYNLWQDKKRASREELAAIWYISSDSIKSVSKHIIIPYLNHGIIFTYRLIQLSTTSPTARAT